MASTDVHKDVLRSTPIQSRHDNGYETRDIFGCNIDVSPIRKKVPYKPNLQAFLKNGSVLDKDIFNAVKINRKLPFTNWVEAQNTVCSRQVDSGIESMCKVDDNGLESICRIVESKIESMCKVDDSGIGYNKNSLNSGNQSLRHFLRSFPTDLNCDIKNKYINSNNSTFYQPTKYICKESSRYYECSKSDVCFSQILDKNNNTVDYASQLKRKTIPFIDFLYELSLRNCTSITSKILSYLSDEDIRRGSYVSKDWQNIIFSDQKANKRRTDYINNRRNITNGPNKENRFETKCRAERNHKSVFLSILNASSAICQQPLYNDNLIGRFDSFCQEVKTLQDKDNLMKCPKCSYPSKIVSASKYCCTRSLCQHEFCKKCSGPYLDYHVCSMPKFNYTIPTLTIGSKKSKKYLRRL